MLALAQSREMQVSERTCRTAPGLGGREASRRALLRTSRIGNSRPSVAEAGLRAHHQTPRRARPARAWARPAGGRGSAKAFGRCFSEIGFRLDLAPKRIVFGLGIKRAGPKTKAKLPTGTARDGVAASALDGRAHPHACRARRGVPWRPRRHAFSGTSARF
jgi:hypothetical protein